MTALSADELMAWLETTSTKWHALTLAHPETLAFPCDIRETRTVAELLHHIAVVELRYAQRILGLQETSYDDVPCDLAVIYATHDQAMAMYREAIANITMDWETPIAFQTRSAGVLMASRRTILVHALMHSIRHYAQLATLVRHHGVSVPWPMDYLFMGATRP